MDIEAATLGQKASGDSKRAPKPATPELISSVAPKESALLALQTGAGNRTTVAVIQHKMEAGAVDDPLEAEADHVAQQVLRRIVARWADPGETAPGETGPGDTTQPSGKLDADRTQPTRDLAPTRRPDISGVARRVSSAGGLAGREVEPIGAAGGPVDAETEAEVVSAAGGQPMETGLRASMEHAFGADFSDVRLHTGSQAERLNRAMGSRAFTAGNRIFFGPGSYEPSSSAGQELLAHELTHVVQQGGAVHRSGGPASRINRATRGVRRRHRDLDDRVIQRDDLVPVGSKALEPVNAITAAIEGLSPFIRPFFECLWRAIQDGRLSIDERAARQLVQLVVALQGYAASHEDEAEEIHDSGGMILPSFIALSNLVSFLVHTDVTGFLDGNEILMVTSWATENLGPMMADFLHNGALVPAKQPGTGAANGRAALTGRGPVPALEGPRPDGQTPLPDIRSFLRNQAELDRLARKDPEYQAHQMAQHLPPGGFEYLIGFRNEMLLAFTIAIKCGSNLPLAAGLMPTCIAAVQANMTSGTLVEILDRALRNNGRETLIVSLLRLLDFDGEHILSFLDTVGPSLAVLDNINKLYSALQIYSQTDFDPANLQAWMNRGMQPTNRRQQDPSQGPTSPNAPKTTLPVGAELLRLPDSALERLVGKDEFRLIREKIGTLSRPYSPNPFLADQCLKLLTARNNLAEVVALLKFFIDNLDTQAFFEQAVKTAAKLLEKNFGRDRIEAFCTAYRPLFCLADVHEPIAELSALTSFDMSDPTLASLNVFIPGLQAKGLTMNQVADLVRVIKVRRNSAQDVLELLTICSTNAAVGNAAQAGQAIKSVCPMYQNQVPHGSVKLLLNGHMTYAVLPDVDLVFSNLSQHRDFTWSNQAFTDTDSLIALLTVTHNMDMNAVGVFLNTNFPATTKLTPKVLLNRVNYLLAPQPGGRGEDADTLGTDFATFGPRVDLMVTNGQISASSATWAKAAFRFLRCTPQQVLSYLQKQVVRTRCTGTANTDPANHLLLFARNFKQRGCGGVAFAPRTVNVGVRQVQLTDWIVHHVLERHSFQYFDFGNNVIINRADYSTMFLPDATETPGQVGDMLAGLLVRPEVIGVAPWTGQEITIGSYRLRIAQFGMDYRMSQFYFWAGAGIKVHKEVLKALRDLFP